MESFKLNTIEEAVADFAEGKFVIVVDDEDRENEGLHAEERPWRTLCPHHHRTLQGTRPAPSSAG